MNHHISPAQGSKSVAEPFAKPIAVGQSTDQSTLVPRPDKYWRAIRDDALASIDRDETMAPFLNTMILERASLREALIAMLAYRMADSMWTREHLESVMSACLAENPDVFGYLDADLQAVFDRDPACKRFLEPLLYFKGFHALQAQRVSHHLWNVGRDDLALMIQSRMSAVFQLDIHPATRIGKGVFFDHGTGIVIGKTAVIDDNVSIMQNVTLGGTGKETGDRHPKVHCGVLIGAGAKVLGNIVLGQGVRVAASSVVLDPVPPGATVAGIPAKIVGVSEQLGEDCMPAVSMDHHMPHPSLVEEGSGI